MANQQGFPARLVEAIGPCTKDVKGASLSDREEYFSVDTVYVDPKAYCDILRGLDWNWTAGISSDESPTNSFGQPIIELVYIDVGAWAGSGAPQIGWTRHRQFGLVCGSVVVLCGFGTLDTIQPAFYPFHVPAEEFTDPGFLDQTHEAKTLRFIDLQALRQPEFEPIRNLLRQLSSTAIGSLHILAATMNRTHPSILPPPPSDVVHVLLGDLHAPVVTQRQEAHLETEDSRGREALRGRLNLDSMPNLAGLSGGPDGDTAILGLQILGTMDFDASGVPSAVDRWFDFYCGDAQTKGAEIFQNAGRDLRTFVDYLRNFHETRDHIHIAQLGDLFDLWMGFQRGFVEGVKPAPDVPMTDFAHYWMERTIRTGEGDHLVKLLRVAEEAKGNVPLRTSFLYGNHDNYRKHGGPAIRSNPTPEHPDGVSLEVFDAPSQLVVEGVDRNGTPRGGLIAEHGHQPDTSNYDEDPIRGHRLTQAAYLITSTRDLEGPASWAKAQFNGPDDYPRHCSLKHAVKTHLTAPPVGQRRSVYAMGHSHEPMLKRIRIVPH